MSSLSEHTLGRFQYCMLDYKYFTDSTAVYPGVNESSLEEFQYLALGLCGEAGEVADIIKKAQRRGAIRPEDFHKLMLEMGDLLYYWTRLAVNSGLPPALIMQENVKKLEKRKEAGTLADRPEDDSGE